MPWDLFPHHWPFCETKPPTGRIRLTKLQWHQMGWMASHITSLAIVYSTVYSGLDQRKRQCSASLAFVRVIHRWPVNSPHKRPVTRKMFPFDNVIMKIQQRIEGCCDTSRYEGRGQVMTYHSICNYLLLFFWYNYPQLWSGLSLVLFQQWRQEGPLLLTITVTS